MHELLLHGQIPNSRHRQLLAILAGISASQPHPTTRRHLVYRPVRDPPPPGRQGQIGGSQGIASDKRNAQKQEAKEFYYLQLVSNVEGEDFKNGEDEVMLDMTMPTVAEEQRQQEHGGKWALLFSDVPDAAKRPVISRMIGETPIVNGDAHAYMKALGYKYVSEYIAAGERFIYRNIIITLSQVLVPPPFVADGAPAKRTDPLPSPLPQQSAWRTLDPSGAYLLEAVVRVQDSSKPDIMAKGAEELSALKGLLRGAVDLRVVDRLAMDSRVKWKPREGLVN